MTAYNRRQLLRFGTIATAAAVLAACGNTAPAPVSVTPATPPVGGISAYIKGIADGVLGAATKLGVSQTALDTITNGAAKLEGIAGEVQTALAAGGAIATYAQEALPIIEMIVSFIPGGSAATGILTAIQTLSPIIAAAAGRQMATRPTGMTPEGALAVLHRAKVGIL